MKLSGRQLLFIAMLLSLYFTVKNYFINRGYYRSLVTGEAVTDFASVFGSLVVDLAFNLAATAIVFMVTYMLLTGVPGPLRVKGKKKK